MVSKTASVKFLSFHSLGKEDLDFQRFYRVEFITIIIIIIIIIITLWNFRLKKALRCLVNYPWEQGTTSSLRSQRSP